MRSGYETRMAKCSGAFARARCGIFSRVCCWSRVAVRMDVMAAWLIAVIGVVYTYVALEFLWHGNWGLGIAFLGYALGNVGLFIAARAT